jgi:hypothetical protein
VDEVSDGGPWFEIQFVNELLLSFLNGFRESLGLSMLFRLLLRLPGGVGILICISIFCACSCSYARTIPLGDLGVDFNDEDGD